MDLLSLWPGLLRQRVERKCIFANVGGNRNELFQNCTWSRILRIDQVAKDVLDFIIA